jgi:hypothetical protein
VAQGCEAHHSQPAHAGKQQSDDESDRQDVLPGNRRKSIGRERSRL